MTPYYPAIWAQLQRADRFDKYAAESREAGFALADTCDDVYAFVMEKAAATYASDGTPAGEALRAATFVEDLVRSARVTGQKTASDADVGTALEQLATVAYVDTVLKTAAETATGDKLAEINNIRLLGREYGVELLRNLVG